MEIEGNKKKKREELREEIGIEEITGRNKEETREMKGKHKKGRKENQEKGMKWRETRKK